MSVCLSSEQTRASVVAVSSSSELDPLASLIKELGPSVVRYPHGGSVEGSLALERWIGALVDGEFDDVVFSTAQGVNLIVEVARQLERERALFKSLAVVRKIARGAHTARALASLGLTPDICSEQKHIEPLLALLGGLDLRDRNVGIQPCDRVTEQLLAHELESRGARVVRVAAVSAADPEALEALAILSAQKPSVVVFATKTQACWLFDALRVSGHEAELLSLLRQAVLIASHGAAEFLSERQLTPHHTFGFAQLCHPQAVDMRAALNLSDNTQKAASVSVGGVRSQLVVIGNGMVGHRLCRELVRRDQQRMYQLLVFGEEPYAAYDRVALSQYLNGADEHALLLSPRDWYSDNLIELYSGERVVAVDRNRRVVTASSGRVVHYDRLVFATGSSPLVPPVPGMDKAGVFVYRTIDDMKAIQRYSRSAESCAVLGAGLLGIEAAKASVDLGLVTHLIESEAHIMPRQLDERGAALLERSIEALGVKVQVGVTTRAVLGEHRIRGLRFADGRRLDVDMLIVAAGVRPRDELARASGLTIARRGGISINEELETSDPNVFALGECAIYNGLLFGLADAGFEMAEVLAARLMGERILFEGADLSTRLTMLGIDVASLGDPLADTTTRRSIIFEDQVRGVYKKLALSEDGTRLLGGVLVGDSSQYEALRELVRRETPLGSDPGRLVLPEWPPDLLVGSTSPAPAFASCMGSAEANATCRGQAGLGH